MTQTPSPNNPYPNATLEDSGRIPTGGTDDSFDTTLWVGAIAGNEFGPAMRQRRWMYVDSFGTLKAGYGIKLCGPEDAANIHRWYTPFIHKDRETPVSVEMVEAEAERVMLFAGQDNPEDLDFEDLTDLRLTNICAHALLRHALNEEIDKFSRNGFLENTPSSIAVTWPVSVQIVVIELMYFHLRENLETFTDLEQALLDRDWFAAREQIAKIYKYEPFRAFQMCQLLKTQIEREEQMEAGAIPATSTIN